MKTRIIQTRFYEDSKVVDLSYESQNLFMYLLTCRYINISGIFELPDRTIIFEHKCTLKQLDKGKEELTQKILVRFALGWVYVINAEKNNRYRNSADNEKAYAKELEKIPAQILKLLKDAPDRYLDSSVDSTVTVPYTVTINNKSEIIKERGVGKTKIENAKSLEFYKALVSEADFKDRNIKHTDVITLVDTILDYSKSTGKEYKDYCATVRNWFRRDFGKGKWPKNKVFGGGDYVSEANSRFIETLKAKPIEQLTPGQRQYLEEKGKLIKKF